MVALADGGCDLLPLFLRRVYASGVVGAGMQENDGAAWGTADSREHAIDVEALGVLGEIRVVCSLEADVGEDLLMVGPGWAGEVDRGTRRGRVEFGEEKATKMASASSGDGLECGDLRI